MGLIKKGERDNTSVEDLKTDNRKESILFLCAHNDDQIVGAGGTLAKYAKEGKKVITIIFSFGETSLPHLQEKISKKTRVLESKKAAKILGESEIYYLGLKEGNFKKEFQEKKIYEKIKKIIKKVKPSKIFTHSIDDPHPDHRATYEFIINLLDIMKYKCDVYSFNVWNLFINFRNRDKPKLVVDISDTFDIKIKAFNEHKSQKAAILSLMWNIYLQAILNGINNGMKYAEVFYKVR
ncbi:MAG: PIG-L deacetylase family protein [Candidatus Woesearchaeota archaeon]